MSNRFLLPFLLVLVLVSVGITRLVEGQVAQAQRGPGAVDLQAAALVGISKVNGVLQALGASGNVIAGPGLVEGTGPVAAVNLYSHGAAAAELLFTMVNLGSETIDVTNQAAVAIFSLPPGHSRAVSLSSFTTGYRWSCAGAGDYQFAWVVRKL